MTGEDIIQWDAQKTLELLTALCTLELSYGNDGVPSWERPTSMWSTIARMLVGPSDLDINKLAKSCYARFNSLICGLCSDGGASLDVHVKQKLDEYLDIKVDRSMGFGRLDDEVGAGSQESKRVELGKSDSDGESGYERTMDGKSNKRSKRNVEPGQDEIGLNSQSSSAEQDMERISNSVEGDGINLDPKTSFLQPGQLSLKIDKNFALDV